MPYYEGVTIMKNATIITTTIKKQEERGCGQKLGPSIRLGGCLCILTKKGFML
jgi:hypothetical protein